MTADRDVIAAVLAEHKPYRTSRGVGCTCGGHGSDYRSVPWSPDEHREHIAAVIAAQTPADHDTAPGQALTEDEREALQDALAEDINDACQNEGPMPSWWAWFITHKGSEQHTIAAVGRILAARATTPGTEASDALRAAADAWTQGEWSNVMLPKPTPPAVPVIAYSNRMGDWLRDRADSLAREQQ